MKRTLVWLRQDLRLQDNPAIIQAAIDGDVALLYIFDESSQQGLKPLGGASKWWLYQSLKAFSNHIPVLIKRGDPAKILPAIAQELKVDQIFWNRCYAPFEIQRDANLKSHLKSTYGVKSFNSHLLVEPWQITNQQEKPFKVFTPFWKACLKHLDPIETVKLKNPKWIQHDIPSDSIDDLQPRYPDWSTEMQKTWRPGELGAKQQLDHFIKHELNEYARGRDFLDEQKTSRLSPHLRFGEISPRQIWKAIDVLPQNANTEKFLTELGWREFSYHLLYHFPQIIDLPLREEFKKFPWSKNKEHLRAWQNGKTGIPVVDAAMQELWVTGYMHNRARMIVASFLTKHLLIPWQEGEAWFWDTLCDADCANNCVSWQWVSGCGADAAPYFRIFNPVLQGQKFDPTGRYVRKWIPQLAKLPDKFLHCPWEASDDILNQSGVDLGHNYPKPIIDLKEGRDKALAAFEKIKNTLR